MAVSKDPIGREVALFGVQAQWPRFRQVKFSGSFARSKTDTTYTGLDPGPVLGGNYSYTYAGVRTMDRWTDMGAPLSAGNALDHALGFSDRWGGGGLYTHRGNAAHPDAITDGGLTDSIMVSCEWYMAPALTSADTPRVPGLRLERRRTAGRGMLMQGSGSGLYFGWAPGGGTTGDSEHTEVSTVTTFDPVPFDLEDLPGSSFTFGATKDVTTTYHPTGADGPGYYPVRGTVTYAFSASLTVEFLG